MNARPNAGRYSTGAVAFHWIMALLIVVVSVLGQLHDSWPKDTQSFWINIHAMVGLTLLALLVGRILWRLKHRPPELPADAGELSRRLSHPVHMLLYALLIALPVLGIITFIWHGRVFDFGMFKIDPGVERNRAVFHPTEEWHGYLAYALWGLAGLHVLAALWHHFIKRDGVLLRMWPAGRV